MYKDVIKRILDIVLSLILLIVLLPLFFLLAFCVKKYMGKPILFSQDRIGKKEKIFKLYKFRSMTDARDEEGNLLDEQQRLTKFGILLRSSSLDELPELWSILKGDMSFIGPRPLPEYYGPYFYESEKKRHTIRGGLIPPDCLCGETTPSWEVQFKYDNDYVDKVTFFLDVKIIFVTVLILLKRIANNYGAEDRPHLNEYRKGKINQ